LNPHKALTQYTRTVWTQEEGLPQDTIRAIAQTPDGYLWLGTTEGLVRFDGYDFVTFTKNDGSLPNNSVTALRSGANGLWIGTPGGLALYRKGRFKTFTSKDGLPPGTVNGLVEDHDGVLWMVVGGCLSRFENGKFKTYSRKDTAPIESTGVVYQDAQNQLWVGGLNGVLKREGNGFSVVLGPRDLDGNIVTAILKNAGGLWAGGTRGIVLIPPEGGLKRFTTRDGLPNELVRALYEDRAGSLWVGTYGGLSRLEKGRFVSLPKDDRGWVWCLFEDREGDLWVGMNGALNRFRDDNFSMYGRSEGLPSDEPIVVRQDKQRVVWVGYNDSGLLAFSPGKPHLYTSEDGLPSNEIFGITPTSAGDLLIGTRAGLSRLHRGRFLNYSIPSPAGRSTVFDAIEDTHGKLWVASASGVYELNHGKWSPVIGGDPSPQNYAVTLMETRRGSLWAGTLTSGLWLLQNGDNGTRKPRLYTTGDGLGSNQIRSLYEDTEGTIWIGTFGGGLSEIVGGVIHHYGSQDGLLSDNISHVEDDGAGSLWLSTTRGICRIPKRQIKDLREGRIRLLTPRNYGVADGLRSAQCAPAFPAGGGGTLTTEGNLWFPTNRGLASISARKEVTDMVAVASKPMAPVIEVTVDDRILDSSQPVKLRPGPGRVQFRYAGIYLRAPERIRYSYKLEGLDRQWIPAGNRRLINYNPFPHGSYRFRVQAALPGGGTSESELAFEVLPRFFETRWFWLLCGLSLIGAAFGFHQLRLKQIQGRFALVFEERARLAREIHDTLAQGFVGISHQLDALGILLDDPGAARKLLNHARKMVRHSLTEARRSMMDLRTTELQERDLPAALEAVGRRLAVESRVDVRLDVSLIGRKLRPELEQNLLRIAQEALANAVKHATARVIWLQLALEGNVLRLRVKDDGKGFEPANTFALSGGHFGIVGMRERAERLGGRFDLTSRPGDGTQVEVKVPIASRDSRIR
jgi:signal transduction histidine kinase/ligand-binding sensor domain-containing protein